MNLTIPSLGFPCTSGPGASFPAERPPVGAGRHGLPRHRVREVVLRIEVVQIIGEHVWAGPVGLAQIDPRDVNPAVSGEVVALLPCDRLWTQPHVTEKVLPGVGGRRGDEANLLAQPLERIGALVALDQAPEVVLGPEGARTLSPVLIRQI